MTRDESSYTFTTDCPWLSTPGNALHARLCMCRLTVELQQQLAAGNATGVEGRALQRVNRHVALGSSCLLHLVWLEPRSLCQAGLVAVPCTSHPTCRCKHASRREQWTIQQPYHTFACKAQASLILILTVMEQLLGVPDYTLHMNQPSCGVISSTDTAKQAHLARCGTK